MDEPKKITDQQKQFCHTYIVEWNAAHAAREAGYSENSAKEQGYRLLTYDHIQAYIKEIQEDLQKLAGISRLSVIAKLQEIVDSKKKEEVAIRDKIKALEVINKMLGFNEPEKTDLTSGGDPIKGIGIIEWVE